MAKGKECSRPLIQDNASLDRRVLLESDSQGR
jgi:hypothetical protein